VHCIHSVYPSVAVKYPYGQSISAVDLVGHLCPFVHSVGQVVPILQAVDSDPNGQ
jgi:hypothetical protein